MSTAPSQPPFISFDEYLRLEAQSEERHDYVDGQMIAMSGGSPEHSRIVSNLIREVGTRLKGRPCEIFDTNLRIGTRGRVKTHYPDASIVCGPLELDPRDATGHTILNPVVIFEVLSPSTEAYDRLTKFDHYLTLPSLREYVLIRQERPEIIHYFRNPDATWMLGVISDLRATLRLRSVDIEVPVRELYDRVAFPPVADEDDAEMR